MTTQVQALPLLGTQAGFRRFSVAEYHRLTEIGILTEDDDLELIEGYLVHKMSRNPPHDSTLQEIIELMQTRLPGGWQMRNQMALTLADSEPEPDLVVVRRDAQKYRTRHPGPADVGLVVEVSDATLAGDRADKGRIYARAGLPCYWIVNVADRQIEVYEGPSGPTPSPAYSQRKDYRAGDVVPFVLDGVVVASLPVQDLLG